MRSASLDEITFYSARIGDFVSRHVDPIDLPADFQRFLTGRSYSGQLKRFLFRTGITRGRPWPTKGKLKKGGHNTGGRRVFLNLEFIQQHLVQQYLANLSIDFPDLLIQRRHNALMFVENAISDRGKFLHVPPDGRPAHRRSHNCMIGRPLLAVIAGLVLVDPAARMGYVVQEGARAERAARRERPRRDARRRPAACGGSESPDAS